MEKNLTLKKGYFDNKKLNEKLDQQNQITAQGIGVLVDQLNILNRQLSILISVEQTQTRKIEEIKIPSIS